MPLVLSAYHITFRRCPHSPPLALQAGSRRGSIDVAAGSPDKVPAAAAAASPRVVLDVQAAAGQSAAAAAALGNLSLGPSHLETAVATAEAAEAASAAAAAAPPTAAAPEGQASERLLRQQEVNDDEDDAGGAGCVAGGATSRPVAAAGGLPAHSHHNQPLEHDEEGVEEEDDLPCTFVWDSSSRQRGAASAPPPTAASAGPACTAAAALKDQGNACLKAGDCEAAVRCYSQALAACSSRQQGGEQAQQGAAQQQEEQAAAAAGAGGGARAADPVLLATLHSNRAQALLKLKRHEEVGVWGVAGFPALRSCCWGLDCLAVAQTAATGCSLHCTSCCVLMKAAEDALQAHRLHPNWPKPLYRCVGAAGGSGRSSLRAAMHAAAWSPALSCKLHASPPAAAYHWRAAPLAPLSAGWRRPSWRWGSGPPRWQPASRESSWQPRIQRDAQSSLPCWTAQRCRRRGRAASWALMGSSWRWVGEPGSGRTAGCCSNGEPSACLLLPSGPMHPIECACFCCAACCICCPGLPAGAVCWGRCLAGGACATCA